MQKQYPIKSIVQEFYGIIDAQEWGKQSSMISEDFVTHLGSQPPESFVEWQRKLKHFYEGFPDGRHILEFYTVEGSRILTLGQFVGSHDGTFLGRAPTGVRVSMKVMHLDRVVDGKIAEHIAQSDLPSLLHQIEG